MTDKLLALAARVEGAVGADRELDGWIYGHMTAGYPYIIGDEPGRFPQKPIYGERLDAMRIMTADPVGAAQYIGAPAYTASLDAALSLVPEGYAWMAGKRDPLIGARAYVHNGQPVFVGVGTRSNPDRIWHEVVAATPALALTAAALRARAAA